jgi:hypothetical protein
MLGQETVLSKFLVAVARSGALAGPSLVIGSRMWATKNSSRGARQSEKHYQ